MSARLTVLPLPSTHRFRPGDVLADHVLAAVRAVGETLRDGDVLCVASKVVSLSEGATRPLPDGDPKLARRALALDEAEEVVAASPAVLVTRTRHGFVAANGGIDVSNVAEGLALLLPDDPDRSAQALRAALREATGATVGVIVTDTFGRAWRRGQTEVALGVAGTAAIRDERGLTDLDGQPLTVTEAAVADELAGAADLVRDKASGTPFVLIRGLPSGDGAAPHGRGADLVRPVEEDLFAAGGPTATERAVLRRRTIRRHDPARAVPDAVLRAAVEAAASAPAPHHTRPWRFVRPTSATRRRLLDAMAARWREDLGGDGLETPTIEGRIGRSDALLRDAPELLLPFVDLEGAHRYPDARRRGAERDLFLLSGGAALQNLQLVLTAHGLGAAWVSATVFCADTVRSVLEVPDNWEPLGLVAIGWPCAPAPSQRAGPEVSELLFER